MTKDELKKEVAYSLNIFTPQYSNEFSEEEVSFFIKLNNQILITFDNFYDQNNIEDTIEHISTTTNSYLDTVELSFTQNPIVYKILSYYLLHATFEIERLLIAELKTEENSYKSNDYHINQFIVLNPSQQADFSDEALHIDEEYYKTNAIYYIDKIKCDYDIGTIVSNHGSWKDIADWASSMHRIIYDSSQLLSIPFLNHFNKKITLLCNIDDGRTQELGFAFTDTEHNHLIKVSHSSFSSMSRIWLHELTHALDYQAGYLYPKKDIPDDTNPTNYYFSHHLINQMNETSIKSDNTNDNFFTDNLINNNKELLAFAINNSSYSEFVNAQQGKDKIIKHLQRAYLIHLLDQTASPWESLSKEQQSHLLTNPKYLFFINHLLYSIQDSPMNTLNKLESLEALQDTVNEMNILQAYHSLFFIECSLMQKNNLLPSNIDFIDLQTLSFNREFNTEFCHGISRYMKEAGLYFVLSSKNKVFSYVSHANHTKVALNEDKAIYWAQPLELFARSVEKLNSKTHYLYKMKQMISSQQKLYDIYPDEKLYTEKNKTMIKKAIQSLFQYVEHTLQNEKKHRFISNKILNVRKQIQSEQIRPNHFK